MAKQPFTAGDFRYYTCRRCGAEVELPLEEWKKLHGDEKRLCVKCRKKAAPTRKKDIQSVLRKGAQRSANGEFHTFRDIVKFVRGEKQ